MHNKRKKLMPVAATLAALAASAATAQAQSSDALIDKLVDKGVLTVREANELRDEADKNFTTAYQVKSGMPDWVNSLRFNGDMRGRMDSVYSDNSTFTDRTRFRYRLRFGVTAVIKDNFEAGFRLTSSEQQGTFGGDPISGNTTFQDNGSKKYVFFDQAYGKWSPINTPDWNASVTVGKMENPFLFSETMFDGDYTPEGGAINLGYNINDKHSLKLNNGLFALDETNGSSDNPMLWGTQLRLESIWTPKIQTSLGAALLAITSQQQLGDGVTLAPAAPAPITAATARTINSTVPNMNSGNSRNVAGNLTENYAPIVLDASVTYSLDSFPMYKALFPIKVGGEYIDNTAATKRDKGYSFGVTFGKSGKKGLWEVSYKWKELQGDMWFEELPDSDFGAYYQNAPIAPINFTSNNGYRAGTNLRGHVIKASYSPFDSLTLSANISMANVIDTQSNVGSATGAGYDSELTRIILDAVWKF